MRWLLLLWLCKWHEKVAHETNEGVGDESISLPLLSEGRKLRVQPGFKNLPCSRDRQAKALVVSDESHGHCRGERFNGVGGHSEETELPSNVGDGLALIPPPPPGYLLEERDLAEGRLGLVVQFLSELEEDARDLG